MKPLGFGQITGIDVLGEVRGVLPSQDWKRNYYKRPEQKKWYAGETISLGIGQGYNAFTMLQLAQATAILANNGLKHKPQLVIATQDSVSRARIPVPADPPVDLGYKPENVAVVRKALVGVPGVLQQVIEGAPLQSRIVVVGVCMAMDRIEPALAIQKEVELRFVLGHTPLDFHDTLQWLGEGKVNGRPLLTGLVGLHGVANAFEALGDPEQHAKILVDPESTAKQPVPIAA